ncbi:hypothetical protein NECAME_14039 [Necator americanus]|uniref:Uncharacterized protein n=2 Tax=Necator americanus TaxID=51031 RepID=W2SSY6_NECAM|nr:hypothetical protein NECAME_14039 [Necator americanus]ETN71966.1 hypothetical protein NECAME_14039 [Necator americanus]
MLLCDHIYHSQSLSFYFARSMEPVEQEENDDPEKKKQNPQDLEQQAKPQIAFNKASVRAAFVRKVFVIVTIMTLASGLMLAVLCSRVPPHTVLLALATTTLSCAAIIAFASQTKCDITSKIFIVYAATVAVFIFGLILAIMSFFIYIKALHVIFSAVVCVLFMIWLAIDTQMIVGGKKYEISPEDYIYAALTLFIDIYQIFISLMSLFNAANN